MWVPSVDALGAHFLCIHHPFVLRQLLLPRLCQGSAPQGNQIIVPVSWIYCKFFVFKDLFVCLLLCRFFPFFSIIYILSSFLESLFLDAVIYVIQNIYMIFFVCSVNVFWFFLFPCSVVFMFHQVFFFVFFGH